MNSKTKSRSGLRNAVICSLALVCASAFFACADGDADPPQLKDCNADSVIDLEDLYCQDTPMGDSHPAGEVTYEQSDVAGSWSFKYYAGFEATYDETGKKIADDADGFEYPPTRIYLSADGTLTGSCVVSGAGIFKWSKTATYTGTMSRDKMSMSGNLELYEWWETGDNQTQDYDWTATRLSGMDLDLDSDPS